MTGLSVRALRRLVSAGRIPHIRYSERVVRFEVDAIEKWIADKVQPVKGAAKTPGQGEQPTESIAREAA
jgi:hypothetical protein